MGSKTVLIFPSRFHDSPLTQSEARRFCEEEQPFPSHLVEIESAEENYAIIAEIRRRNFGSRNMEFWRGITDRHSEGIAEIRRRNFGARNMEFWLGITDRHSEGRWVLESTGKSVVFTNWNSGEPNNAHSGENCAYIINANYKWNDHTCNEGVTVDRTWMWTALCEKI